MFPADFAYVRADSLPHALDLLARARGNDADIDADIDADVKLLAGGQSLLPMMKLRLANPGILIDIGGIASLRGVTSNDDGSTAIGALTTYRDLERDPVIATRFPAITDALRVLADQQVRARGTIGGCVAHGDPAADLPAVLLAMDATVTITGPAERARVVGLGDFLQGVFTTDLAPDEIVTAITLPAAPPGQAYEKFEQPASHLPLAGACAVIEIKDGRMSVAQVAVTGVAPRPFRAFSAERSIRSSIPSPAVLREAASLAGDSVHPLSDQHASGPYRLHLAEVVTRRALDRALDRAIERTAI